MSTRLTKLVKSFASEPVQPARAAGFAPSPFDAAPGGADLEWITESLMGGPDGTSSAAEHPTALREGASPR